MHHDCTCSVTGKKSQLRNFSAAIIEYLLTILLSLLIFYIVGMEYNMA
jgi:hypothetical protein